MMKLSLHLQRAHLKIVAVFRGCFKNRQLRTASNEAGSNLEIVLNNQEIPSVVPPSQ